MSPGAFPILVALVLACGVAIGPGCARSAAPAASPPAHEPAPPAEGAHEAPGTTFEKLEARLGQTPWRMRLRLEAEGVVVASLEGSLSLADEIDLAVSGRFAGGEHDLRLWTEGDRLRGGPAGAATLDLPRPPELAPALVIGLTRMGLLHNVAMLVAGKPPDGGDGGITQWVQTIEHERIEAGGEVALGFAIVVAGQRVGRATLWLDARGRPVRREQTVDFPEGQMRVVERYEWLEPLEGAG